VNIPSDGSSSVDMVNPLAVGFITKQYAQSIAAEYPETAESIAAWIREAARARDWRRVERLANLAALLQAPGLGEVLREILDADVPGLNNGDDGAVMARRCPMARRIRTGDRRGTRLR
jgi:hypothetical protein